MLDDFGIILDNFGIILANVGMIWDHFGVIWNAKLVSKSVWSLGASFHDLPLALSPRVPFWPIWGPFWGKVW